MSALPYGKFAEVYDSLMDQDQFYESYYSFIIEVARMHGVKLGSVLDLACGTGKLSEIFTSNGIAIEGIDKSGQMLSIARKRGVKAHRGDMADFRLKKKFDAVVCIFDSLNYLLKKSGMAMCFSSVYSHLKPGGLFVFDVNSDYKINHAIPKFFDRKAVFNIDESEVAWANSHRHNRWIVDIVIKHLGKNFHERHVEGAFRLKDLRLLMKKTGFSIIGAYSDFDFSKVKKNSLKWFFVCRKI